MRKLLGLAILICAVSLTGSAYAQTSPRLEVGLLTGFHYTALNTPNALANPTVGSGMLEIGLVWRWQRTAFRVSAAYGFASQTFLPVGTGLLHAGQVAGDLIVPVTERFHPLMGLGASMTGNGPVGLTEWSLDFRFGARLILTDPHSDGVKVALEAIATMGYMATNVTTERTYSFGNFGTGLVGGLTVRF